MFLIQQNLILVYVILTSNKRVYSFQYYATNWLKTNMTTYITI